MLCSMRGAKSTEVNAAHNSTCMHNGHIKAALSMCKDVDTICAPSKGHAVPCQTLQLGFHPLTKLSPDAFNDLVDTGSDQICKTGSPPHLQCIT